MKHVYPKEPNHDRRRFFGMLTLLSVLFGTFGTFITITAGVHPVRTESFAVVPREAYRPAYNPIALAELGLPPDSNASDVGVTPASSDIRAIVIKPDRIAIMVGGTEIWHKDYDGSGIDLTQVTKVINDASMIEETTPGQIVLKVALIVRDTALTIGSPQVSKVSMVNTPSVFIGTQSGALTFDTVTIQSIPSGSDTDYQPFVMATDGATMNVVNSKFTGLGWDWNASYGVSWVEGSTGAATGSIFENSFIGAYTSESTGIIFRDDAFRNNALYGLDPHTYSSQLTIDHVLAEGNHAHGIIFSDHVTDSTITNSVSRNNGENGIMMDEFSTNNTVEGNEIIDNIGDGLVTANSTNNTFVDNTVSGNRIGVRLSSSDGSTTKISGNQITYNGLASENATLDGSNTVTDNGGQWNQKVVFWIWFSVVVTILLTLLLLLIARHRKKLRQAR